MSTAAYDEAVNGVTRRLSGAARKFEALATSVQAWNALKPVSFEAIVAADELSYDVIAHVDPVPPLEEWKDESASRLRCSAGGLTF